MRALLLKDFYNLKSSLKTMGLILLVFLVFLIARGYEAFLAFLPVLLSTSLVTTTVNMDANCRFSLLMLTAPLKKEELMREKFFLVLAVNLSGAVLGAVLSLPFLLGGRVKAAAWLDLTILGLTIAVLTGALFLTVTCFWKEKLTEQIEIRMLVSYLVSGGAVLFCYTALPKALPFLGEEKLWFHGALLAVALGIFELLKGLSVKKYVSSMG